MGTLEQQSKKKRVRKDITSIVLKTIGVAGIVGVGLIAPNAIGAMAKLGIIPMRRQKEIINRARDRLVRQGLLKREGMFLELTSKGKKTLKMFEAREFHFNRPKKWDRRWRILIFDIPEYRRSLRDRIRETVRMIGFVHLQHSVWAYPYDCEDLVALLKADLKVGKDMLYMIVEELEGDYKLKKHFNIH
jgi:DNA-binding transcriptional regulator PaaX